MTLENLSDQLEAQAQETADIVKTIGQRCDLSHEQAAEIVKIAAISQLTDVFYHIERILDETTDALNFGYDD